LADTVRDQNQPFMKTTLVGFGGDGLGV